MGIPGGGAGAASGSRPTGKSYIVGSESVDGQLQAVVATSSPGTTIHTVPSDMRQGYQMVAVHGCNIDTVNRMVTLQPGATATKDLVHKTLGARRGFIRLTPKGGLKMARGAVLKAYASATNVINVVVSTGEPDKFIHD